MKPMFATESNRYAQRIDVSVHAGTQSDAVYLNAVQPYKISCISGKFASQASGTLKAKMIRGGTEITVFSIDLSSAGDFVVSDINMWLSVNAHNGRTDIDASNPQTDVLVIDNQTDQALDCVIDFAY